MRPNRLRQLLDDGQPTLGTRLMSSWPTMLELVGHSRMFDYVEFVAEYSPYDLYTLENLGRAVDLFDHMSAMIKIQQESRLHLATRAIGAGIQMSFSPTRVMLTMPRSVYELPGLNVPSQEEFRVLPSIGPSAFFWMWPAQSRPMLSTKP